MLVAVSRKCLHTGLPVGFVSKALGEGERDVRAWRHYRRWRPRRYQYRHDQLDCDRKSPGTALRQSATGPTSSIVSRPAFFADEVRGDRRASFRHRAPACGPCRSSAVPWLTPSSSLILGQDDRYLHHRAVAYILEEAARLRSFAGKPKALAGRSMTTRHLAR